MNTEQHLKNKINDADKNAIISEFKVIGKNSISCQIKTNNIIKVLEELVFYDSDSDLYYWYSIFNFIASIEPEKTYYLELNYYNGDLN